MSNKLSKTEMEQLQQRVCDVNVQLDQMTENYEKNRESALEQISVRKAELLSIADQLDMKLPILRRDVKGRTAGGTAMERTVEMLVEMLSSSMNETRGVDGVCQELKEEYQKLTKDCDQLKQSQKYSEQALKKKEECIQQQRDELVECKRDVSEKSREVARLQEQIETKNRQHSDETQKLKDKLKELQECAHQFSKKEFEERKARTLDVLIIHRDCSMKLASNLAERVKLHHPHFNFAVKKWTEVHKTAKKANAPNASAAILLFYPQNRVTPSTAPELERFFQTLGRKLNVFLPTVDEGNSDRPPVPSLASSIATVRQSGWIEYSAKDGPSANKLRFEGDELLNLEHLLVDAAAAVVST